jgi:hypothetical protein
MKKLVTSYTFDASAKTVDSADFTSLEKIQLITNVTDQIIIYNFADSAKGGSLSSTTLTLDHDTTAMDDTDKLQIFVEDGAAVQAVSASSLPLPTGASTAAKQPALGTAGSASADVITVQGVASMTPLSVTASALALETGGNLASAATSLTTVAGAIKAEDAAHSSGDTGLQALTVRRDSAASTAGTDGDYAAFTSDNTGRLWTRVGIIDALTPGTSAANLGKAEDAVHASGDTGVFVLGVRTDTPASGAADGDYVRFNMDSTGRLFVNAGSNIAHDDVDAQNPVKMGGQARTTNPTAVADADRSNFITDKLGKQVVVGSIRDLKGNQVTTITASTSETTVVTAAASTFHDIYGIIVTNTSATATEVAFKDSTGGTTQFTVSAPANDTRGFMLPESGAIKQSTVNNNWTATAADSVSSLLITVLYVKNL